MSSEGKDIVVTEKEMYSEILWVEEDGHANTVIQLSSDESNARIFSYSD
jgi:hypothetical protein